MNAKDIADYMAIDAQPSATVRKFQLMKRFGQMLPPDAKRLSTADIAALILEQITKRK